MTETDGSQRGFRLIWPNPPRTTTKQQYKNVSQWLRKCARLIEPEVERKIQERIEMMCYG